MILTIRTDKPEAEIGLFKDGQEIAYEKWQAHRQLAETIHHKIKTLLAYKGQSFIEVRGVVVFMGPGSYTGLRIGVSVANALAYSLGCPVVATNGPNWIADGTKLLDKGQGQKIALPEYESPAKTTKPRK